jgi:hypothetical protein
MCSLVLIHPPVFLSKTLFFYIHQVTAGSVNRIKSFEWKTGRWILFKNKISLDISPYKLLYSFLKNSILRPEVTYIRKSGAFRCLSSCWQFHLCGVVWNGPKNLVIKTTVIIRRWNAANQTLFLVENIYNRCDRKNHLRSISWTVCNAYN